jgi:signal transduction histidine kinase
MIAASVLYFFSKKILAPLTDLSNKSMEVAKGNFKVSVEVDSAIPELQATLENFNFMINELNRVETLSSDFINNVSHEFKTPLSVIRSYVNIIENNDLSNEEKKEYLKKINESIDNLSSLISNILQISKLLR